MTKDRKSLDISPAKRQRVIHRAHLPEGFHGSLCGHRAEVATGYAMVAAPGGPTCKAVAYWSICLNREWVRGQATNAWDAVDSILAAVRRHRSIPPCGGGSHSPAPVFSEAS